MAGLLVAVAFLCASNLAMPRRERLDNLLAFGNGISLVLTFVASLLLQENTRVDAQVFDTVMIDVVLCGTSSAVLVLAGTVLFRASGAHHLVDTDRVSLPAPCGWRCVT